MKKGIILLGLVMTVSTLFSCKKDYTCKCSKIYNYSSGSVTVDDGSYVFKDNKVRAEHKCNAQEKTGSDFGVDYSRQCDI